MANCDDLFREYVDEIRVKQPDRSQLKISRNAIRERVRSYFKETLGKPAPKFTGQGSYRMHTGIIPADEPHDLDDGVYLQGLGADPDEWPSAAQVHRWLVDATTGYTSDPPRNKHRCVRVPYKAGYHVDLPSYGMNSEGTPMLFDTGASEPYESDPVAFSNWFASKTRDAAAIRDLVRILKGWKDYSGGASRKASGLALTILVAEHYVAAERLDVSLVETVKAIHAHLSEPWPGGIYKPVTPTYENLAAKWTEDDRRLFLARLKAIADTGDKALDDETGREDASKAWQGLFGPRFPLAEDEVATESFAIVRKSMVLSEMVPSHVVKPWWPTERYFDVTIRCSVYAPEGSYGNSARQYLGDARSDVGVLPSGLSLKFEAVTLAPNDYSVRWQVVNTGAHARWKQNLRGSYYDGTNDHWETTEYTGRHWVKAFLLAKRNGRTVQIGESRPFYVNVENPDYPTGYWIRLAGQVARSRAA